MTPAQKSTLYALISLWIGLIAWDVFLGTDGEPGTTISAVMKTISRVPAISYVFGVLAGHLFWNRKGSETPDQQRVRWYKLAGAVAVVGALVAWDVASSDPVIEFLRANQIVAFAFIGVPLGHLLWPQYSGDAGA